MTTYRMRYSILCYRDVVAEDEESAEGEVYGFPFNYDDVLDVDVVDVEEVRE